MTRALCGRDLRPTLKVMKEEALEAEGSRTRGRALRESELRSEGNEESGVTTTLGSGAQETKMQQQVGVKSWASTFFTTFLPTVLRAVPLS